MYPQALLKVLMIGGGRGGAGGGGKVIFNQLRSGVGQSNQLGPTYQLGQNDQFLLAKLYNKDRFYQICWLERF